MVNSPPAIPEITHAIGDDRRAGRVVALLANRRTVWFHSCLPVFMSSAIRWLSIVTRKSLPL